VCYALIVASWPLWTICTMMERAWTYTMDFPKRVSTLPEAASERDQRSPHHPDRPLYRSHLFHTITSRIPPFPTSRTLSMTCHALAATCCIHTTKGDHCSPHHNGSRVSLLERVLHSSARYDRCLDTFSLTQRVDDLPYYCFQTISHARWT
jgi:hypothetical protein